MSGFSVRLRQAVLAARDLDDVASRLRRTLSLGEPFSDPGVGYFGLRNAVFALGDTFLEVLSPIREGTSAGRLLDRRGSDCGYMLMFQIEDLGGARERARDHGVREVFEVSLEDIGEVHLHPADMRGAIVSLSHPTPPSSWRWGGPGWETRSTGGRVAGATVAVADPEAVRTRWQAVLGVDPEQANVGFIEDIDERGLVEVVIADARPGGPVGDVIADSRREPLNVGGVRFVFHDEEEDA